MKTLKAIIFASAALLAAAACTKEANPKESVPSAPGTIEVNVTALIGDLAPSEGTKATMDPVIRLTWANGDVVYAYDATQKIGELTVTPASDGLSAKLTGALTETPADGTTIITLVYCNTATEAPTITGGKISFDLSAQDDAAANPFVVYATLGYEDGLTSITDKIVPFTFATSLMRVTVTGIANEDITAATVSGVNTACELAVSATSVPTVAGTTSGSISRTAGFTRSDGRAVFNVSVAAEEENTGRTLTINQGTLKYGSKLMSGAIAAGASIISVYALTEQTGSRGTIGGHDYVYVAGKKWATQNLTISRNDKSSGDAPWKPGSEAVKVPGTDTDVVVGDYFQWGAYPGYCGNATAADKGLLVYSNFSTLTIPSDSQTPFSFKSPEEGKTYQFNTSMSGTSVGISPYYKPSAYEKYFAADKSYRPNLDISDDVAHTLWGGSWRMPTSDEFKAMKDATYWAWDGTDKGYYVFMPGQGTDGLAKKLGAIGTSDDKSKALLFFPAAGYGKNGTLAFAGRYGYYGSSSLLSAYTDSTRSWGFGSSDASVSGSSSLRFYGYSVRPLSD